MRVLKQFGSFAVVLRLSLIIALLFLGSRIGLFAPFNGLFQDTVTRWTIPAAENTVVVVDLPLVTSSTSDVGPIVAALAELGSTKIVLGFDAGAASLPKGAAVVIGVPANPSPRKDGTWVLARPLHVAEGALVLPPATHGIHRQQATAIVTQSGIFPTLEAVAAGIDDPRPFYLRFAGGANGIAHVTGKDLLSGRVPAELVSGRVALVGYEAGAGPGLSTALDPSGTTMNPLDFHAFALQTLLSGRVPRDLSPTGTIIALVVAAALGIGVFHWAGTRGALWALMGVMIAIGLASAAAHTFAERMLPTTELLALQIILAAMIWHRREVLQDHTLRRTARDLHAAVGHVGPSVTAPFPAVTSILELRRSVLLKKVPGGRLVVLPSGADTAAGLPATFRDGRDRAFSEAGKSGKPVAAQSFPAMQVVPLLADGQLAGYWLVEPVDPCASHWEALAPSVASLALDLGRLISASPNDMNEKAIGKTLDRVLTSQIDMLRDQMRSLERALDHGSTAMAVRDLLGESGTSSAGFSALASRAGLERNETDPVSLVVGLTGLSPGRAAEQLRRALLQDERVSLPLNAKLDSGDAGSVLRLSSLAPSDTKLRTHILFEVADQSEAMQLVRMQATLGEQLNLLVRNDLEAVELAAALIVRPDLPAASRPKVLDRLAQAVARARTRLAAVEPFLNVEIGSGSVEARPVDLAAALDEACQDHRKFGQPIDVNCPDLLPAVIAAPDTLQLGFRSILAVLRSEALPGHSIKLMVTEVQSQITVTAEIDSSSMSQDRLQGYLTGEQPAQSEAMRNLSLVALSVSNWGGRLEGHTVIAKSLRFDLRLKKLG